VTPNGYKESYDNKYEKYESYDHKYEESYDTKYESSYFKHYGDEEKDGGDSKVLEELYPVVEMGAQDDKIVIHTVHPVEASDYINDQEVYVSDSDHYNLEASPTEQLHKTTKVKKNKSKSRMDVPSEGMKRKKNKRKSKKHKKNKGRGKNREGKIFTEDTREGGSHISSQDSEDTNTIAVISLSKDTTNRKNFPILSPNQEARVDEQKQDVMLNDYPRKWTENFIAEDRVKRPKKIFR